MGHIRLGRIPKTKQWQEVLALLDDNASSYDVTQASIKAIAANLQEAGNNQALINAFYLLTQITQAAKSNDFVQRLQSIGLTVSNTPNLFELTSSMTKLVENSVNPLSKRNDLNAIAIRVMNDTLSGISAENSLSLFQSTTIDLKQSLRNYSSNDGFSYLSRQFFSNFFNRYIQYYLGRAVPERIGAGSRFESTSQVDSFNKALSIHCFQTAKIVEEFSGGWYGKHNFKGGIDLEKSKGFVGYAMKKIKDDFTLGEKK